MNDTVKVKRGSEEGEIDRRFLQDFLNDGWKEVKDDQEPKKTQKQLEEEARQHELDRDRQIAKARSAELKANEEAMARIAAENEAAEDRRNDDIIDAQVESLESAQKDHETRVLGAEDKDEVADYIEENFDKKLDKRGELDKVQDKALKIIEEFYDEQKKNLKGE